MCAGFCCCCKPLPLGEVSPKVTERASPARQGLCAAIGSFFVRAILSLHMLLCQHPCPLRRFAPAPPKGEPLPSHPSLFPSLLHNLKAKVRCLSMNAVRSDSVDFFLGTTTPAGFKGYFEPLRREPGMQMYLIKSGPGCGKSTLMKIGRASCRERV